MASRILGMGDVLTLIEKAEATFDAQEAEKAAEKMIKGEFTLEDFLAQFQQMKKMGPLQELLAMIPGASSALRNVEIDEREIKRVEAIIYSMTPEERRNPKIMNGSRKRRVAAFRPSPGHEQAPRRLATPRRCEPSPAGSRSTFRRVAPLSG